MRPRKKGKLKTAQTAQTLLRSQKTRIHGAWVSPAGFAQRRAALVDKERGLLCQESDPSQNPQQQMLSDPSMMNDMMAKNLNMIVPQLATGAWVNFFFSGFVVARVPFPLTQGFRVMLQRGVDLASLDVTYISSLSWYFLNLFGMRGLLDLALGETTFDDTQMMQQQMSMQVDEKNAFKAERNQIELVTHRWRGPAIIAAANSTLEAALK